jgi:hypothetical protein
MAKAVSTNMDQFANKAYVQVIESSAGTLTYSELQSNINIMDKVAWVIHRVEYYLSDSTLLRLAADQDSVLVAWTSSNKLTTLDLGDASVIDFLKITVRDFGTPGNNYIWNQPIIREFNNLPGGGLIVAPRPLYLAILGGNLSGVATVSARMYFTVRELSKEDYYDLLDFYRIVS